MEDNFRQDTSDHENDDALSLSDLPIYGGGADETPENEDLGVKEYTSSLSFEFLCEEWSSTILSKDSNDNTKDTPTVVFCGKIMRHNETPAVAVAVAAEDKTVVMGKKKGRKFGNRMLSASLWNFNSSAVSGRYIYESGYKDGISMKRVNSIVAAPRVKRDLYILGMARFSPEMDMRDLRRKLGSSICKRSSGGSDSGDGESKSSNDGDCGKGVGWWILIKVLGCGCGCRGGGGDDHDIAPRLGL